jgi:hypothetical protein
MSNIYRTAEIYSCILLPWTLLVGLVIWITTDSRVPPWDRAAIYSLVAPAIDGSLLAVPLLGIAGAIVAIRAIRRQQVGRRGIITIVMNVVVVVTFILIWARLLVLISKA